MYTNTDFIYMEKKSTFSGSLSGLGDRFETLQRTILTPGQRETETQSGRAELSPQ